MSRSGTSMPEWKWRDCPERPICPTFGSTPAAGPVGTLAFSPDGKYLVGGFGSRVMFLTGGDPFPVNVWEVATRRLVRRLYGHTRNCAQLDFSTDGRLLASAGHDGIAILWSTATWKQAHTLLNQDRDAANKSADAVSITCLALSPDSKTVALASLSGGVELWDTATGKLEILKGHSAAVMSLAFSRDGRTLASGGLDQTVRLWNVQTRRELMQLDRAGAGLRSASSLAFSQDGSRLLAAGGGAVFWSTRRDVWNEPERAAEYLRLLLRSKADFKSRVRMFSENLRLHKALEKLDAKDLPLQAALAAAQANWHASRSAWPEAARAFDRLVAADPTEPAAWLRTPGLLRLATASLASRSACRRCTAAQRRCKTPQEGRACRNCEWRSRRRSYRRLYVPLQAEAEKRLAKAPNDVRLLELRLSSPHRKTISPRRPPVIPRSSRSSATRQPRQHPRACGKSVIAAAATPTSG